MCNLIVIIQKIKVTLERKTAIADALMCLDTKCETIRTTKEDIRVTCNNLIIIKIFIVQLGF